MREQDTAAEHENPEAKKDATVGANQDSQPQAVNADGGDEAADVEAEEGEAEPEVDWQGMAENRYEQLVRLQADFENFRRRVERDRLESETQIINRILHDLLPVYDNLERAVKFMPTEGEAKAWRVGVEMTLNGFNEALARLGVQSIATVGNPFNPSLHEAVQQVESTWPEGIVAEEVQKGFRWRDRVLRAALVKVSSGAGQEEDAPATSDDGQ